MGGTGSRTCDLFGDDEKKPESQPAIPAAAVHGSALNGSDKAAAVDENAAAAVGRGGRGGAVGKPRSDFALPFDFFENQWLDVKDGDKWFEAQVVSVDSAAKSIEIHYKGYKKKHDQVLQLAGQRAPDWARVAPVNTYSVPFCKRIEVKDLSIGTTLDTLDSVDVWRRAIVTAVDAAHAMVKIHFLGWGKRYDEWIHTDSYRLAPLNSHTSSDAERTRYEGIKPSEATWALYCKQLSAQGLTLVNVQGDGNCLFRAVSVAIYGNEKNFEAVRQKCVEYMQSNAEVINKWIQFEPESMGSLPLHIVKMTKNGTWGTNLELRVMHELYGRDVEVYNFSNEAITVYRYATLYGPPIRLSMDYAGHFDTLIRPEELQDATLNAHTPGEYEDQLIAELKSSRGEKLRQAQLAEDANKSDAQEEPDPYFSKRALERLVHQYRTRKKNDQPSIAAATGVPIGVAPPDATPGLTPTPGGDGELSADDAAIIEELERSDPQKLNAYIQEALAWSLTSGTTPGKDARPSSDAMDRKYEREHAPAAAHDRRKPATPEPVTRCLEMGFNKADVEQAYAKFRDDFAENHVVISNMAAWLHTHAK